MSTSIIPSQETQRDNVAPERNDTIAAIATPPGIGGVGIVRISGPDAYAIGLRAFQRPAASRHEPLESHHLTYGHIVDPATAEVIDEVLVVYMCAPRTYTREDVVEIHTHGGPLLLRRVLDLVLASGARAANPGEMTLRAFLNGRLDLAQAEAVMALINAETDAGHRLAMRQLRGELSERVEAIRTTIMAAVARIEASIDFPEEEVPEPDIAELRDLTQRALIDARRLLATAGRGRAVREGIRIAIVGRPNVGKSSLLNALLRVNRAIVTPIAGTTRDTVEERAILGGMAVHLIDTAGLTATDDPVEQAGVERSREAARAADLLLLVLDSSEPLNDLDRAAVEELERLTAESDLTHAPVVAVLNKSDLPTVLHEREAEALSRVSRVIRASAVARDGVAALEHVVAEMILGGEAQAGDMLIASARHEDALRRAEASLIEAESGLDGQIPLDLVSIDLREALAALGEITGETATEDILDRIFSEFCIGK